MNVLSLFDGISCGQVALERAGIKVNTYYASEIDKYAIQITQKNYPNTIQLGDVLNCNFNGYKDVDLLLGGSPCTYWSIARKDRETTSEGLGFELFMQYVRALDQVKPKYFLYENNHSIHKDIKAAISEKLGVQQIMINSALVSAQQRKRCYWTNIPNVSHPEDVGILLKDILESGEPYQGKAHTITASYNGAVIWNSLERHQRSMVFEPINNCDFVDNAYLDYAEQKGEVAVMFNPYNKAEIKDKAPTLTCQASSVTKSCTVLKFEPVRLGQIGKGGQGDRIYSVRGKSVCLSANGGGRGAKTGLYKIDLPDGDYIVRKLTPIECERLQTLPDNYTEGISNTQRYKALGNGWTVDVIAHILSFMEA